MGQVLFLAPILILTYTGLRRLEAQSAAKTVLMGLISGLLGGAVLAALVLLGQAINLRDMFINASPQLFEILTFGQSLIPGIFSLLLSGLIMGSIAAGIFLLPARLRSAVIQAVIWVVLIGLLRDLIITVVAQWAVKAKAFPAWAAWARASLPFIGFIQ
jgi:hypothetical protein